MYSKTLPRKLSTLGFTSLPTIFIAPGQQAARRFLEFFTPNTREAYYRAATLFGDWCQQQGLELSQIEPMHVAAYIETLLKTSNPRTGKPLGKATGKQHLAAIRRLFDWLVIGQVIPVNPAYALGWMVYGGRLGLNKPFIPTDGTSLWLR